jgi:DnaJ homolog subfamily C member 7
MDQSSSNPYVFGKGGLYSDSGSESEASSSEDESDDEPMVFSKTMGNTYKHNHDDGDDDNDNEEEDSDDNDYTPSLPEVIEEAADIAIQIVQLETIVNSNPTIQTVHDVKDQVASIFGVLEDLQFEIDSLVALDLQSKIQRRNVTANVEEMFTKIADLSDKCLEVLRVKADEERVLGNTCFKKQEYLMSVGHYSNAISIDKRNATLYTNRALAHQKMESYDRAISDAKCAVAIDVNYLKAYVILIKSQLIANMLVSAAETLGDIPNAFADRIEVTDLANSVAAAAKDSGNISFKSGDINEAISMYSVAISCDPSNHVYYSNRSAAYQSRKSWREALNDAERCLLRCSTFAKAYIHKGRSQIQLKRFDDAEKTVAMANRVFEGTPELVAIAPQLADISKQIHFTKQQTATREALGPSQETKAEQFKDQGNKYYKQEEYSEAIRFYTQALSLMPNEGSYYGNRAAAWLMMKEYKRAIKDCLAGLDHEKNIGSLDKLRIRHASALAGSGFVEKAINILEESVELENRTDYNSLDGLGSLQMKLTEGKQYRELGLEALENKAFSRSRRLFENSIKQGLTDDPKVLLGLATAALGLHEYEEASRTAQKVIEIDAGMIEAYVLRADALLATGCTDLAEKHLKVALQRDPDNSNVQKKLKKVRKVVNELTRIRGIMDTATNEGNFEAALIAATEGLDIDKESKKIMSEMHGRRSKIHSMMATACLRLNNTADPVADAAIIWKKSLQEANSSLYYDSTVGNLSTVFLKCAALQALERWEEAHNELEQCYKGIGEDNDEVTSKFKEAKLLLKKSKRPDLYKILGITTGQYATEPDIKKAYKKAALKWHPDRHSRKGEEAKKEAEDKFKQIADAFELLTDTQRKALYDQGYDREEIESKMEEEKQRQEYSQRRGGRGGYGF